MAVHNENPLGAHGRTAAASRTTIVALLWIVLVGLLATVGWLLLTACGIRIFGYQNSFCPMRSDLRSDTAPSELDSLFRRVQELEKQATERPQCRADGPLRVP